MTEERLFQQIGAYRTSHKESRVLFGTLIGDIQRDDKVTKSNTFKNPSDADCIRVTKKFMANNVEVGTTEALEENKLLSHFVPQQLTQPDINSIVLAIEAKSIGECMQYFKKYYFGLYSGKTVQESFIKNFKK